MANRKKLKSSEEVKLYDFDPSKTLGNVERVFKTFMKCLEEGDDRSAIEVLAGGLYYLNKAHLARRYGLPRRTAYNLLSKDSNPSLSVVAKVCHALRQESTR